MTGEGKHCTESEGAGMKEYIEKAAVKDEILSWAVCINHPELLSKEDTMHCIDNVPTADVAEVRHGRWNSNGIAIVCSECGKAYGIVEIFAHYCPWCGSRMDKEADHETD